MMNIPIDWDKPSPGNDELCEKFEKDIYAGQLPYRLYVPADYARTDAGGSGHATPLYPLVIYLHGADAVGSDNEMHLSMHDIGTMFVRDEWQKRHPCFVLAPQCRRISERTYATVSDLICELTAQLRRDYPYIDADRIYLYGYSAGAVRTMRLIKEHPGMFAAAIPICGATDPLNCEPLLTTPIWMFHAADDDIVKVSYRTQPGTDPVYLGSRDIYDLMKGDSVEMRYTEYPAGYMKEHYGVHPHCAWVPVSQSKEAMEWLFSAHVAH